MGICPIELHMQGSSRVFSLDICGIQVDGLGDTAVCIAQLSVGLIQLIQGFCPDGGRYVNHLLGNLIATLCCNGYCCFTQRSGCEAQVLYRQRFFPEGIVFCCFLIGVLHITSRCRICDTFFNGEYLTQIKGLVQVCAGHTFQRCDL